MLGYPTPETWADNSIWLLSGLGVDRSDGCLRGAELCLWTGKPHVHPEQMFISSAPGSAVCLADEDDGRCQEEMQISKVSVHEGRGIAPWDPIRWKEVEIKSRSPEIEAVAVEDYAFGVVLIL